jgi:general secretion pathway protein A
MYLKFFGLREQPFGVTPDPRFLYLSAAHREALASLYYGIEANRGFLGLIARPGMGKTTILFHLLEKFRSSARTAFIFQTQCNSREFLRFLLGELGYEDDGHDFVRMHEEFNKRLLQEARAGNRLIVVIDEAQNLDSSVLETVRLLSDFETPRAKLLHIILAGQPELADKLASPGLQQLRQRVSIVNGLEPLPSWEIKNYIEHRLRIAGYEGEPLFAPEAYDAIANFTDGIPRNINNFCFNALSLACALRKKVVDDEVVKEVMADLDITKLTSLGASNNGDRDLELSYERAQNVSNVRPIRTNHPEALSPAEAAAYMQQVALKLKNWQESLDKIPGGVRRRPSHHRDGER